MAGSIVVVRTVVAICILYMHRIAPVPINTEGFFFFLVFNSLLACGIIHGEENTEVIRGNK